MERIIYDRMAELDSKHWWYRARRRILARLIERYVDLPQNARILEIGCGSGHNLGMLAGFGTVDAVEMDDASRAIASKRLGKQVGDATLPELMGIALANYDLVALLDVLEHVEDDAASLKAIAQRLKPSGKLLLTVPAHPWMWGGHDVANHHKRRYTKKALVSVIESAGYKIEKFGAFNSLLFPLAVARRMWSKVAGSEGSEDALPPAPLNWVFENIFGLEAHLAGRVPLPPGLSFFAIVTPVGSA